MTTAGHRSVLLTGVLLSLPGCSGDPKGSVRLTLDGAGCSDFCAVAVGAALYPSGKSIPIGPIQTVPCGQPLVFKDIPAGQRLVAEAWAMGDAAVRLLDGWSGEVTVAAGETMDVSVRLEPVELPVIGGTEPGPVPAPGTGGTLVVIKGAGFGDGEGLASVTLDGEPVEVVGNSWSDTAIDVAVKEGQSGAELRVQNCGVASAPAPMRVMSSSPGAVALDPPACAGMDVRAAATIPGSQDLILAASCASPAPGFLQRFLTAECALSAVDEKSLPGSPRSLTVASDGKSVWVALEKGAGPDAPSLVNVSLGGGGIANGPALEAGAAPAAVAVTGPTLWIMVEYLGGGTGLFRLDGGKAVPVAGLPQGSSVRAVTAAGDRVLAALAVSGGGATLAALGGTKVESWMLAGCDVPTSVAAGRSGKWAVVGCEGTNAGMSVVRLDADSTAFVALPWAGGPGVAVIDDDGGAAFARDGNGGSLAWIGLESALAAQTTVWGVLGPDSGTGLPAGRPLAWLTSGFRLVLAGPAPGPLALVSPYRSVPPCPVGGR